MNIFSGPSSSAGKSFSSTSVKSFESIEKSVSELSINTALPIINRALGLLDESPIPLKKLNRATDAWIHEKSFKLGQTLKRKLGRDIIHDPVSPEDARDLINVILRLKHKFHDGQLSNSNKIQILTILPPEWSVQKICENMETSPYLVKKAKQLFQEDGILSTPAKKKGMNVNYKSRLLLQIPSTSF